jgi:acetyl esterase/lipase
LIFCSGANLAAATAHYAASQEPSVPLKFLYLNVPVVDLTAYPDPSTSGIPHPYPSWIENSDTPSLTPAKTVWFKNNYLPPSSPTYVQDLVDWRASPIFAPDELFTRSPKHTFVSICEVDILRDEGLAYAEKIRRNIKEEDGKTVTVKIYAGAPHPVMAMDQRLKVGRECIDDAVAEAVKAFADGLV